MRFAYAKSIGLRRLAYGGGSSASEQLLTLATAAGAEAVYNPDDENTWTLRDDGADLWYSAISDGLGNREDMEESTAAAQMKQVTLSTGRRAMRAGSSESRGIRAILAASIAQPNTIVIVFRNINGTGRVLQFDSGNDITATDRQILETAGPSRDWGIFAGSFVGTTTPALDSNFHFEHVNFDGASSEIFLDGTSIFTGNAGTNSLGAIGRKSDAANAGGVEIGPIIVFASKKTNAELSDLRDHIDANWPIGLAA